MTIDELFKVALTKLADQSFTVVLLVGIFVFFLRERGSDVAHYRQREAMFTAFTIALVVGLIRVVEPEVKIPDEIFKEAETVNPSP